MHLTQEVAEGQEEGAFDRLYGPRWSSYEPGISVRGKSQSQASVLSRLHASMSSPAPPSPTKPRKPGGRRALGAGVDDKAVRGRLSTVGADKPMCVEEALETREVLLFCTSWLLRGLCLDSHQVREWVWREVRGEGLEKYGGKWLVLTTLFLFRPDRCEQWSGGTSRCT